MVIHKAKAKLVKLTPEQYKKFIANKWRDGFDKLIVVLGLINVIATIPQVIEIWSSPHARGVSVISWAYYVVFTSTLLIYSVLIKSKPMIFTYTANTAIYTLVLVSAIIVKAR